nr:site-specific integrase [Dyella sp. ASV24]
MQQGDARAALLGGLLAPGREYQSVYGYTFAVDSPTWELAKGIVLNVASLLEKLEPNIVPGCLATLVHFARTASAHHAYNQLERYRHMVVTVGGDLTSAALINYRSTLDRRTEFYLGTLRGFIYKWHELGYPGVDDAIVELLRSWSLKGNIKGDAVQRRDPGNGDLTENELIAFNEGAARAFEKGQISMADLAMALLTSCTGRRARQISHMKVMDVELSARKVSGELQNLIQVPRAKQQGGTFRDSFGTFRPSDELWRVIQAQRKQCIDDAEKAIGRELDVRDRSWLPLFPDVDAIRACASLSEFQALLARDRLHCLPQAINDVLTRVVELSVVNSERTGELLKVSSRRFRYTIGTRAACQGIGIAGIAKLLDHTDTQNAHVYIKNVPEHVDAIDAAVGHQLAPYARAFQGVLVDSERDARRGDDPASRISHRGRDAATCGKLGMCGANVPIPCYTCIYFQPWLDGPHEMVYAELLADRRRILDKTGDETIASINDRTIFAVADVIQRCRLRREELAAMASI